jgi:hypothetical protein
MRRILGQDLWPDGFDGRQRSWRDSPIPHAWSKLTLGPDFALPRLGPVERFYDTTDSPDGLIDRLGAAHAEYVRTYVERYRRGRPADDTSGLHRTQGHYLWKLNDTFAMIYSTVIDALDEPNLAYYALRRAYAPVLLSFDIGDLIHLWLVNDSPHDVEGRLTVELLDTRSGDAVGRVEQSAQMPAGASGVIRTVNDFGMFDRQCALVATLESGGDTIARTIDFAQMERRLAFPQAQLSLAVEPGRLTISSDTFARRVWLSGDDPQHGGFGWRFCDNGFDLLPDRPHRVTFDPARTGAVTATAALGTGAASAVIG